MITSRSVYLQVGYYKTIAVKSAGEAVATIVAYRCPAGIGSTAEVSNHPVAVDGTGKVAVRILKIQIAHQLIFTA